MTQFRFLAFLFLITFYSCNQNPDFGGMTADTTLEQIAEKSEEKIPEEKVAVDRKVIKEGDISFETANAKNTRAIISKSISDLKGYVSADNVYDYTDKIEHRITMRVPSGSFDLLLERISEHAKKLDSKDIRAIDVTAEYIDVESRIRTKKELEGRYNELLKKATKVDEILVIEKEMGSLRTEIESMEGQLKYLQDRVSFSTLTVTFYEKNTSGFGFSSKLGNAIKNGWTNLLWFFLGLANLWPFLILGGLAIIMYRRFLRKKAKEKGQ